MPKLGASGNTRKINLSQIIETGNVRQEYGDIEELAGTIKANGQLQPVLVKAQGKNADGADEYELVAGHRRLRAFRYLCDNGDDFSRIDAIVVTGDKLTLQLIENLQRSDLSARERERGIYEMTKDGNVPQRGVAAMLGKSEQFVSRNISAYKIRELAEKAGVDTSGISTAAICEISAAADGDIPFLLQHIKDSGSTLAAARKIGRDYRGVSAPAASAPDETPEDIDELAGFEPDPQNAGGGEEVSLGGDIPVAGGFTGPSEKPKVKGSPRLTRTLAEFDPPHKQVDINDVLVIIREYIDAVEGAYTDPGKTVRTDAAWDIIALLHKKL
jgi:ParB/RepB/Spo0J family partition protein